MSQGFTLRKIAYHQNLGFWWTEKDGTHCGYEMPITDNHPLMVALQLKHLSQAIEKRHNEHPKERYAVNEKMARDVVENDKLP